MNKLIKGAIAGAAGLTLLMGGAGTFALWNASAAVSGGTIIAGDLDIVSLADGVWTNGTTDIAIADYRIVPGDTLTYTETLAVTATGDNIAAQAGVDLASISPRYAEAEADIALAAFLSKNTSVVGTVEGAPLTGSTFSDGNAKDVTMTVTIVFPSGVAGTEDAAKLGSVTLNDIGVTLTQVAP